MNRRSFLRIGLGATVATLASRSTPAFAAIANPVLVVVFLRGGVDALSVVPPRAGTNRTTYLAGRPTIRIGTPAVVTDPGGFGLHPSLVRTRVMYEAGEVAFVLGAGSPNQTRSHFEQMAFIEGGDPVTRRPTGYLNRALSALSAQGFGLQAVALQDDMPLSLRGPSAALRVPSLDTFGTLVRSGMTPGATFPERVAELSVANANVNAAASEINRAATGLQGSVAHVQRIVALAPAVSTLATYGTGAFADNVRDAARIIAAEPRVRIVEIDSQKFDTHAMQGNESGGDLRGRLDELDKALGTFVADAKRLGFWNRTCIVVMSEFGRTVKENGSKGTDHGRGGVAFVAGPTAIVRGKRIVVPAGFSLATGALTEGRDLPVTTDLRAVMGDVLTKHLAVPSLTNVFPGWTPTTSGLLV
jgi:uncharacterized protein (DUF1501 family)